MDLKASFFSDIADTELFTFTKYNQFITKYANLLTTKSTLDSKKISQFRFTPNYNRLSMVKWIIAAGFGLAFLASKANQLRLILLQQNLSKELVDVFSKTLEEAKKVDPNSAENMTIIYLFASIALVFLIGFITYFWYNERKKDNLMNTIIEKECADNIQRQEDRREIANLTVSLKLLAEKLLNFINYQQKRNEG